MRKENEQKRKGFLRKSVSGALALLLAGTMLGSLIQPALDVEAAKAADLDTTTKYEESLGDEYSTMYSGRVWTDKTVKEAEDDNFGITYSALSTSQEISGVAKAPLDVVFIIDISGSMVNSASGMKDSSGNTYSRMKFTLDALNKSIETLMSMNENTRVAVVAFSTNASVLLPLGHYAKKDANTAYFSLSTNTPLGNNVNGQNDYPLLYTNVSGRNQTSTRVYGGTNIQKGIYTGMNLLTNSSTTVSVDGQAVNRVPVVVMLSDGAPTYSVDQTSWWAPTDTDTNGNGSLAYYGNGMKAMMTATYMKAAINRNYTANPVKFYTIGMGITGISNSNRYNNQWYNDGAQDLAYITLDPKTHWNDNNTNAASIRNAWNSYIANNGTGTPYVTVGSNSNYRLTHPSQYDITTTGINSYIDGYYSADTADSVNTVFSDIVSKISVSTPEVPTHVSGNDPLNDGYVVFTDPIGKYMEVKSVDSIVHRGTIYKLTDTEGPATVDGVTTTKYIFEHDVETYIHGTQSLSEIDIVLTEDAAGNQTMTISIPAGMIPLRINTIELNADKTVKSHTHNSAIPIQVNYTVGLIEGLKNDDDTLNLEPQIEGFDQAAYEAYIEENTTDGVVNFYSNLYTGTNIVDGDKAGDATVEFKASATNPFYYMQKDTLLYTDPDCTVPAEGDALAATQKYYYKETYYHGTSVETDLVERTGAQLSGNTVIVKKADGYWYRQAGTVRVNRMLEFLGAKPVNNTKTAEDFYAPSYDSASGNFKVYLGNNGVLGVTAAGSLAISKEVTAADGLTAPDKVYTFTMKLTDADNKALTGTYKYEVTDAAGEVLKTSTISNGGTIELEADQTATIINLPPNAKYEVTETAVTGFTTSVDNKAGNTASGTIAAGETVTDVFTNHYEVEPTTFPADSGIKGKKVLEGRPWDESVDSYTFRLIPYNDEPLPEVTEITVTKATNNEAEFDFGSIEFTKPGVYRYTIVEREPSNDAYIAGISYSRALYRVVVTVTDNGDGTLKVESDIQKLYTDGAEPLFTYDANDNIVLNSGQEAQDEIVFTNTYSAESVVRVPVALKSYTDNSGVNPLVSGMFKFELTPMGVVKSGELVPDTANQNPMPLDGNDKKLETVITENEGTNVTFLPVTFSQEDIPEGQSSITFRYQMSEVRPAEAIAENGYTVDGMTYDPKVIEVDVTVSVSAGSKVLNVNAVYPNDESIVTFVNEYNETPVVLGEDTLAPIGGTKTLTGRDMKDGESFEFKLEAADDATEKAIADGAVVPEKTTAAVSGGTDEAAAEFDFGRTTFKKQGTYTFKITESVPTGAVDNGNGTFTLNGVTYDAHVCTVTVVVTDTNKDSILEAVVTYGDSAAGAVYNNTYKAIFDDETAISLTGTKSLTGRELTANSFFFEVTLENSGARAAYVPAAADGSIKLFDNVTYTEAGVYTYLIKEQIPTEADENNFLNGVTYDDSVYRVTVTVTDDKEGNLTAEITKLEKSLDDGATYVELTSGESVVFANRYDTTNATVKPDQIVKVLEGREWSDTDTFTFRKSVVSANPADGVILPDPAEITIDKADNGIVQFNDITFTKPGTYVIKVEEVVPEGAVLNEDGTYTLNGITYSTNVIQSTFEVTDNGLGALEAVRVGTTGSREFKNVYDPNDVTLSGEENLKVTKVIDGRNWFNTDSFTFELAAADDATKEAITADIVVMPETEITIDKETALTGDTAKMKAFGSIVFKEVGEYNFTISEKPGTIDGLTYDTHSENVTVKVTDDGSGFLKATVINADKDYTFTNTYKPTDTSAVIKGKKQLNGRTLKAGEFSFTITAVDGAPLPAETTVQNAADGSVTFGSIDYTAPGTYEYVIAEEAGNLGGVAYDASSWNVTVAVTYNSRTGAYETPVITYGKNDISNQTGFTFVNTYTTTGSDAVAIEAEKSVDAFAGTDFEMKGGEFEFTITPDTNNPAEDPIAAATVVNAADGTVKFAENIVYTAEGTYIYTIEEVKGTAEGVTYDDSVYTVAVTVTDDSNKAQLQRTVVITKDGEPADAITFKNEYRPGTVTLEGKTHLKVNKTFTGRKDDQWLDSDVFTFTLAADAETQKVVGTKVILPGNLTLTVDKNNRDNAYFGDIIFTEVGSYTFLITETNTGADGITYDSHTMKVTVHVTDNQSGKLIAAAPVITDAGFMNKYDVEPTTATIQGKKTLNGRELAADEFEFAITALTAGAPMPDEAVVKNAANGKVVFGPITFTAAGEYHYEITETAGSLAGVSYDGGKAEAVVTVTDNHNGTLSASVSYKKNGADIVGSFEFVNTYTATPVSVALEGLKMVEDTSGGAYELAEAEFKFKLTPAQSNPESDPFTESVAGNNVIDQTTGKFTFVPNGQYTEPGTYIYDITEVSTGEEGIEYDASVYKVTVEVEDLGGMLSAKTTVAKNGVTAENIVFTNKYVPEEATALISGKKVLNGKDLENGEFNFVIEAVNDLAKENLPGKTTVANDETGVFQFDMLRFKEIGTYIYKVFEAGGDKSGISYDGSVYTVEVEVSGNLPEEEEKVDVPSEEEGIQPIAEEEVLVTEEETQAAKEAVTEETPVADETVTEEEAPAAEEAVKEEDAPVAEEEPAATEETPAEEEEVKLLDNLAKILPLRFFLTGTNAEGEAQTQAETDVETNNTGELYAAVIIKKGEEVVSEIVFENDYTPGTVTIGKGTSIPLTGTKSLTGRTLEAGEFVFEITTNDANAPLPADPTAVNAADGSFEFGQITFDEVGTYYYTIIEKNNRISGITYDKAAYTVKVEVTDEGFDGQLDAAVTITDAPVIFENKYDAAPAKAQISAAKELSGRALKAGEFEFLIEAVTEGAPLPAVTTAKNDAQGVAVFEEIEFAAAGDYTYKITEVKGTLQNVTYDTNVYEVTIHVTDNLKGHLIAEFAEDFEGIKFVNSYTEPEPPKEEPKEEDPAPTPVTPPTVSPKTGDGAAIGTMLLLAAVALAGIFGINIYKRKKQ